ncbi:hypothetical protein [Ancylobacter polymorphus]|uniref:Uncharacterized protein n=1 Tax=Ancylobacter polymorphus TaxID=223390 RepID=A0ABU0B6C8_9HYPH|nr:hypothetical protein [Ancylobacter polymorphus]MDQ0301382.1 hypothetical protein [Ancylobacter polymorphus]
MLLPLYLRREPTTDPVLRKYAPDARRPDVVAYRDAECTRPAGRWPWHYKRPDRRNRSIVLNCYRWRAVWLPPLLEA